MTRADTGLVHSVQARIVNHAKKLGVEATLVFSRYGLERFLYRLSTSEYAERFILKGAMLMLAWVGETVRATRDADLLGFGSLTGDEIVRIFREIMSTGRDPEDGVVFLPETLAVNPIREGEQYGGQRVTFEGRLGKVKLPLQVDVGIGDAVYPPAEWMEYPSLLNVPRPMVRTYQPETSIAEKLHAIVDLGEANSRMKDFFDIAELARIREFDGAAMSRAIRETFARRKTPVVATPVGLTSRFGMDAGKQRQWEAFVSKNRIDASNGFEAWVLRVAFFAGPVLTALSRGEKLRGRWQAGGQWWIPEVDPDDGPGASES
jgi:predicted nucleotidyltransferase component of viral defense system